MRICLYCNSPIPFGSTYGRGFCSLQCESAYFADQRNKEELLRSTQKDLCPYCGQDGGLHAKCRLDWQEKDPAGFAAHEASEKFQQKVLLYGCGGLLLLGFVLFVGLILVKLVTELFTNPPPLLGLAFVIASGVVGFITARKYFGASIPNSILVACASLIAGMVLSISVGVYIMENETRELRDRYEKRAREKRDQETTSIGARFN